MRIARWLDQARALGVPRLDAQLLLAHHLQRPRAWLLAHDDEDLTPVLLERVQADLLRRSAGEPLAYLLGEREFHGLLLRITPAVLVPRPETELLVDWALSLKDEAPAPTLVDLGTGSGAIALACKHAAPELQVDASDASAPALEVARDNGRRLQLQVHWRLGDWWAPHAGRRYGLAVANPPYVAAGDPHLAHLRHEPQRALTPGGDGLGALRQIVAGAAAHLWPGAWLLLEHGFDQGEAVRSLLRAAGFEAAQTRLDLAGLERCSGARLPRG